MLKSPFHPPDLLGHSLGSVVHDTELDTISLWQGDEWLVLFADDHDVCDTCGKFVSCVILQVDDLEGSWVLFAVHELSDTTNVLSSADHAQVTWLELDNLQDLSSGKFDLDGVVHLDGWIWESDSSSVVCNDEVDTLWSLDQFLHSAKLVGCFFSANGSENESSLGIVQQSVVLVQLIQTENIHESTWKGNISAGLCVHLDKSLLAHHVGFSVVQCQFHSVSEDQNQWNAFTKLVWT